jgi:NADH dehydrogenase FAD-containing subunit
MTKTVTIYGSGVAGMQLAKALSGKAKITVVSPIDYFEVPMAMPRLLVEPGFADRAIVPISQVSNEITYVQGALTAFGKDGATVKTPEGDGIAMRSDISVLATGSRYANSVTRAVRNHSRPSGRNKAPQCTIKGRQEGGDCRRRPHWDRTGR